MYLEGDRYMLADESETVDILQKFEVMSQFPVVKFWGQHYPEKPLNHEVWGGGCCFWGGKGECPSGHHYRPGYLYSCHHTGKITVIGRNVTIGEDRVALPMLEGHRCKIVIIPDVESLSDLPSAETGNIEDLLKRLENLKKVVNLVT